MNGNFRAALALSIAIVLASFIGSAAFLKARRLDQTIRVTGSSKKRIKSDLMVWGTSVTVEAPKLPDAYARLTHDVNQVRAFLVKQGFPENQIVVSAAGTTQLRHQEKDGGPNGPVTGYQLRQSLEIRSPEIDKLTIVSRNVTQLITQGIFLESEQPEYLYTRLSETKLAMLSEAAKDARQRAEQIVGSTGAKVGEMRSAEMGVLQITAADSNDVSGSGINDTRSLEKDVTAVVHITFAVE
jgi:hypothetical protein